jgi:hypothetical protein
MPSDVEVVNIDEMHHFLKKRAENSGFGERMILSCGENFPGLRVGVMMQPAEGFSTKSGKMVDLTLAALSPSARPRKLCRLRSILQMYL